MDVVAARVFLFAPDMVAIGGVSVGLYPLPIPEKIAHSCQSRADAHAQVARAGGCTPKGGVESPVRIDGQRAVSVIRSGDGNGGTGSPAVYPDPAREIVDPKHSRCGVLVTLLVSVGFPVMVRLRVPSELTEEVPKGCLRLRSKSYRWRSLGGFVSRSDGVKVGWYPMTPLAMVAVRFPLPVGLPENERRESRLL